MAKRQRIKRDRYFYRDLPSRPFFEHVIPLEFREFFKREVLPTIKFTGYKLPAKRELGCHIVHNLILSAFPNGCVADSRNTHEPQVKLRVNVWDAVIAAGLAKVCLGSEESKKTTRYRASAKLLDLREEWELRLVKDLTLIRNTQADAPQLNGLVVLHSGKVDAATGAPLRDDQRKQPVPLPDVEYFRVVEDLIELINANNLHFSWHAFRTEPNGKRRSFQPDPCLRQVHCGELFRAARLYGHGQWNAQSLSKDVRRTMLIGGEEVAELDFSGMATRLLYHRQGYDPRGDVYMPEKVLPTWHGFRNVTDANRAIVRDLIKTATNICWNVSSAGKAASAVAKTLREHPHAEFLGKVLRTEGVKPKGLIERLVGVHAPLADQFFTEVGLELMTLDGKIMLHILKAFAEAEKPALALHDAVVVRRRDVPFATRTMRETYRLFTLHNPVIKRVF